MSEIRMELDEQSLHSEEYRKRTLEHERHSEEYYQRHTHRKKNYMAEAAERCLYYILLVLEGLWVMNLAFVFVAPMPTEDVLPRDGKLITFYSVTPLVELKAEHSLAGVGYSETDAIDKAQEAMSTEMLVSLLGFLLGIAGMLCFRRSAVLRRCLMFTSLVITLYAWVM